MLVLLIRGRAPVTFPATPRKAMMELRSEKQRDVFAVATVRRVTSNEVHPGTPPPIHLQTEVEV